MAKKKTKQYNKTKKQVKKLAKSNPKIFAIFICLLLVVGTVGGVIYFLNNNKGNDKSSSSIIPVSTGISFHFMELGNKYTGDSIYIKAGETDILIDAGSRQSSASAIKSYVNQYCLDNKLEYVIATHADQDHISGFVGTKSEPGIFDSYKIDTLIDFSKSNKDTSIYNSYISLRDSKVSSGDITNHYTAQDCISGNKSAKKIYTLAEGITMEVLDQKFYRESTGDENDYSVCLLFTQGSSHYLFTGDLEKKGEESLISLNNLPTVELFKAGHHGSYTASNDNLLSVIKPKVVVVTCVAGSTEYTSVKENTFPSQAMIDRVSKYTREIYVTTMSNNTDKGYESFNGNIVYSSSDGVTHIVNCSNNNTFLKDSDWFKANRH